MSFSVIKVAYRDVTVDKSKLAQVLENAAGEGKRMDYTSESWSTYDGVRIRAEAVYASSKSTQEKADAAVKALTEAQSGLEKKTVDTPEPVKLPYEDVKEGDWFYDSVYYNYVAETMTGKDETHFAPVENLARAQFAIILHRMNDEPKAEYTDRFPDVKEGDWYAQAVLWAAGTEVVKGYENSGLFGPADQINREQMAVMMYRYAGYLKEDITQTAEFTEFADAEKAMHWAVGMEIITGKNEPEGKQLDPQGTATRAECAAIIQRFMEKYEK